MPKASKQKSKSGNSLPDIQKIADTRGIAIDQVGISDLKYPIQVLDRNGKPFSVVAEISMSVHLPHHFKGTHMSRFLEVLTSHEGEITMRTLPAILRDLKAKLDAESAYIDVKFSYFIEKEAPVSKAKGKVGFECAFIGSSNGVKDDFALRVKVPVTTLCPCSKEISDRGAHNQRGYVTLEVKTRELSPGKWDIIWIEELVEVAERSASAPVYSVLKRTDERYVTMQAYDNPAFVEDVVRHCSILLNTDKRIQSYKIEVVNQESIHEHNAFAKIRSKK